MNLMILFDVCLVEIPAKIIFEDDQVCIVDRCVE